MNKIVRKTSEFLVLRRERASLPGAKTAFTGLETRGIVLERCTRMWVSIQCKCITFSSIRD